LVIRWSPGKVNFSVQLGSAVVAGGPQRAHHIVNSRGTGYVILPMAAAGGRGRIRLSGACVTGRADVQAAGRVVQAIALTGAQC
jgi:hypothetical protein